MSKPVAMFCVGLIVGAIILAAFLGPHARKARYYQGAAESALAAEKDVAEAYGDALHASMNAFGVLQEMLRTKCRAWTDVVLFNEMELNYSEMRMCAYERDRYKEVAAQIASAQNIRLRLCLARCGEVP